MRCDPPPKKTPSLYPCIEPQGGAESIGSQQVVVWQVSYGNIMEISKLCKIWEVGKAPTISPFLLLGLAVLKPSHKILV